MESSLGRVPQALMERVNKFRKSDRVGRRGLFEPREDFSRLNTYAFPRLYLRLYLRLFPQIDSACPRSA